MNYFEIEERASDILEENNISDFPVNLDLIAHRLNVKVEYTSFDDNISGLIVFQDNGGKVGINNTHPNTRQRFTLAHELGHYVLHKETSNLFIDRSSNAVFRDTNSSTGKSRVEIQANQFAAALLMPRSALLKYIDEESLDLEDENKIRSLAKTFGVSMQALAFRLSNLRANSESE